jgi:hypothetical protein
MVGAPPQDVARWLRATLDEVERSSGLQQDDPDLVVLQKILLRKIAELELKAGPRAA